MVLRFSLPQSAFFCRGTSARILARTQVHVDVLSNCVIGDAVHGLFAIIVVCYALVHFLECELF